MTKTTINICYSSDNNFAKHLAVAISSLLINASQSEYPIVYILDGGISEENKANISDLAQYHPCEIHFINIDQNNFANCHITKDYTISKAAYYRLKLPSLLSNIDKIIYLDADTVTLQSLLPLWEKDITNHYIAATQDFGAEESQQRLNLSTDYINSGVLVMNLGKMRTDKLEQGFFELLDKEGKHLLLHDQDILNKCCSGAILPLEIKYNSPKLESPKGLKRGNKTENEPTVILHFLNKYKPWIPIGHIYYKLIYYKYFNKTKFATFSSQYLLWLNIISGFLFSTCQDDKFTYYKIFGIKLRKKRPTT